MTSFSYIDRSCVSRCSKFFFCELDWFRSFWAVVRCVWRFVICFVRVPIWFEMLPSSEVSFVSFELTSGSLSPSRSSASPFGSGGVPVVCCVRPLPKDDDGTNGWNLLAGGGGDALEGDPGGFMPTDPLPNGSLAFEPPVAKEVSAGAAGGAGASRPKRSSTADLGRGGCGC